MKRNDFFKVMAASGMGMLTPTIADKVTDSDNNSSFSSNGAPIVIAGGNGFPATKIAMELIQNGADALDAVVSGVNIVENDPEDITVGYGGVPYEERVVQLDACCMH